MPSTADDVLVRPLTSRDVPKVRELHSKLLPVQYPISFFLQLLLIPSRACFVAYRRSHPNIPVAFVSAAIQHPKASLPCFTMDESAEDHPFVSTKPRDKTTFDLTKSRLEILTLGVLPAYQHRGLARKLIQRAVDTLGDSCANKSLDGIPICAHVATSNTTALKFYENIGLQVSPFIIRNLYRTLSHGSKDAYLVVGVI